MSHYAGHRALALLTALSIALTIQSTKWMNSYAVSLVARALGLNGSARIDVCPKPRKVQATGRNAALRRCPSARMMP